HLQAGSMRFGVSYWCPESEVRFILRLARERTSDSKDTSKPMILVWFGSEIRLMRLAGRMKRISEPPHLAARLFHSSPQGAHTLLARHGLAGRALEDHFTAVDHVNTVGNRRRAGEIRFGQQQRNSKSLDHDHSVAEPFHHHRGKTLEGFVEDHQ